MPGTTLADIRAKVRKVTARLSPQQLTDAEIDQYINTYYLYDMPESLRLLKLKDFYTFQTVPNVDTYDFDNAGYITVDKPCYVAGYETSYYQDPEMFFRMWPNRYFLQQIATGNGTPGPYTGVLSNVPALRNNAQVFNMSNTECVILTANTSDFSATNAIDDGLGGWKNQFGVVLAGNINYITGAFTITFDQNVPAGIAINAQSVPYVASRPLSILFFRNQFILRPVPDISYRVEMIGFRFPTELLLAGDSPEEPQWWQLLAYGASLKVFADNGDLDQLAAFRPIYEEQLLFVNRRTMKQLANQRTATIFSDQGAFPLGNLYPYI